MFWYLSEHMARCFTPETWLEFLGFFHSSTMQFNYLRRSDLGDLKPINENVPEPAGQQPRRGSIESVDLIPIYELDIQENTADEWFHRGNSYFLKQEYEKAILYLGKAISLSPEDGMIIAVLGFCHEFGLGTALSYSKAEEYYVQGCKLENGIALIRLAFLRYYGRPGVMINRVEAESLKKKANELPKESFEWLLIAAEQYKIPAAMYAYGVCFHDG